MDKKLKIVILEDDKGLNELISRRLKKANYDVFNFQNAKSAIEWLALNRGDLIITDLELPDYSGDEFIDILSKNNINIPFIVATGKGSESIAVEMLKKGAKDYLIKDTAFLDKLPSVVEKIWRESQLEKLLKKSQEQVRIQHATLSSIKDLSPDGILAVDEFDKVISSNKQLLNMWDVNYNDFENGGEKFFKLIATKIKSKNKDKIAHIYGSIKMHEEGLMLPKIKVNNKIYDLHSSPILNDGDVYAGRVWYFKNITQHEEARMNMKKILQEVEKNARLRNQFFAFISHDIKTPLNSILGFGDLLLDTELNDKQADYLKNLKTASNHMLELVKNIVDFTKIENDKFELNKQDFYLVEQITESVYTFQASAMKKGLKLEYKNIDAPEIILNDALRFKQVINNLISNAIKFTENGFVRITSQMDKKSKMLIVTVADSGTGIAKSAQKNIFTPFEQEDASIAQSYGGSGLGLAISKMLVEKMGGKIALKSEKGNGSTFKFSVKI